MRGVRATGRLVSFGAWYKRRVRVILVGTDTDCGKTTVACALLRAARRAGVRALPFKLGGKCNDTYTGAGDTDYNNIPGDQSVTGNAECAKLWRTEPISIPLAVAGGALLTLGIAILVNSRQKTVKDKTKATASRRPKVGVGIGSISLSGRF